MEIVAKDYKGKWFVLQDADEDDWSSDAPHIDLKWAMGKGLMQHVYKCRYYGIPAYVGKDKDLNDRIEEINKTLDAQELATQSNDGTHPQTP